MPRKRRWPKPLQLLAGAEDHYRDLLDRRRALAAREEEQDFYEEKRTRHGNRSCGTMVACRQAGQFLARIVGSVSLEGGRQSFTRPHATIVGDRHVEIGDCGGTADPACLPTVNHGGKCEVPANCSEHVGQALGRCPASSFHSCGYGGAIYTKPGVEREETSGGLGVKTDFPTPRVPEDEDELTVQQIALQDQPPHL